jgi:hypothetical protein
MKRVGLALAVAAILASLVPATAIAGRVIKFTDHRVGAFCEGDVEGGFVSAELLSSVQLGQHAVATVWLDGAIPFEDPPTWDGLANAVNVNEGNPVVLSAALEFFVDHESLGSGSITATMTRSGDPIVEGPDPFFKLINQVSHTHRTTQPLEGEATLTMPDDTVLVVGCAGEIVDESVFETSPHAFRFSNKGVFLDCFWQTDEEVASLHVEDNDLGFNAGAGLGNALINTFSIGSTGSIDNGGFNASIDLVDDLTGDPYSAEASGTFTPIGELTTSFLVSQTGQQKLVEQRLVPDGSITFSTGDSFSIDYDHCFAETFDVHSQSNVASGPKPAAAPPNDAPDGAIELHVGDRLQVNTSGTALDPEVPITTCPDGPFDDLGHTVWYTVKGTGGVITADTSGTRFDTVMAVYLRDGDDFTEIACVDDVLGDPIGADFQAAISGPTEEGVTYWIQVGGFRQPEFVGGGEAQFGRLKLQVR